jgi:magnesium transporter
MTDPEISLPDPDESRVGAPPGLIEARADSAAVSVSIFDYGPEALEERTLKSVGRIDRIGALEADKPHRWIRIVGARQARQLESLASSLGLSALSLEDALQAAPRPKWELLEETLFMVLICPQNREGGNETALSVWRQDDTLITFEPEKIQVMDRILERLRAGRPRLRHGGVNYLTYVLVDLAIDSFLPVIERVGIRLEELETHVLEAVEEEQLTELHTLRRELIHLRRVAIPQRDLVAGLWRDRDELFPETLTPYLRDCHDHAGLVADAIDGLRELAASLTDLVLARASHRQNEVMKVLTIFAAIFIPLSFIAGLYGMNFERSASSFNLPELGWRFGYPACLALMATVAGAQIIYFRRRGWIGGARRRR